MQVDRNDHGRATAPVAWQELGALAGNAAAAHGSCFLLGHALRGFWISRTMTREVEPRARQTNRYFQAELAHGFPPPPTAPNI